LAILMMLVNILHLQSFHTFVNAIELKEIIHHHIALDIFLLICASMKMVFLDTIDIFAGRALRCVGKGLESLKRFLAGH